MNRFKSKSEYLNFRQAWRESFNKIKTGDSRKFTCTDMILFNLMRGSCISTGFAKITNSNKLMNGHAPYLSLSQAHYCLKGVCLTAKLYLDKSDKEDRWRERRKAQLDAFLQPYHGTITIEMLAELHNELLSNVPNVYRGVEPQVQQAA